WRWTSRASASPLPAGWTNQRHWRGRRRAGVPIVDRAPVARDQPTAEPVTPDTMPAAATDRVTTRVTTAAPATMDGVLLRWQKPRSNPRHHRSTMRWQRRSRGPRERIELPAFGSQLAP